MEPENKRNTRLQKLSNSDFEIVDGESDIRGWDVKDASGKQIGEVEELIFDYESRKVRYLVVDLEENDLDLDDKEVLVPIGIAQLHEDDDDVILNGVTAEQLRSLPEYDEDRFDTEHETSVRNVFGGLGSGAAMAGLTTDSNNDFYSHEHFNEENLYRNRRGTSAGETTSQAEEFQTGRQGEETGMRFRSRITENELSDNVRLPDDSTDDTVRNSDLDLDSDESNDRIRRDRNDD